MTVNQVVLVYVTVVIQLVLAPVLVVALALVRQDVPVDVRAAVEDVLAAVVLVHRLAEICVVKDVLVDVSHINKFGG